MSLLARMQRLDNRVLRIEPYQPLDRPERLDFLTSVAEGGMPWLGPYGEGLRPVLTEQAREITALRAELQALRRQDSAPPP